MSSSTQISAISTNAIIESAASAEQEIAAAWQEYQQTEKHGLNFGRVCYECQKKFGAKGKRVKGQGVSAILRKLNIPERTYYFWLERYKVSIGEKAPNGNPNGPSGRQLEREAAAAKLEQENLFPRFDTTITPAVVGGAPDGIGFNVTFKNLKGAEAVRQLSNMPLEVPTGVQKLVEVNKAHFAAVFGNLPSKALEGRIAKLVEILNEQFGGGA
jgi:hypothetical protein